MFDTGTFDNATFDFTAVTVGTVVGDGGLGPDPWKKKRRHQQEYIGREPRDYEEILTEVSRGFEGETQEILAPSDSQDVLTKPKPDIIQLWDEDDEELLLLL